MYHVWVIKNPIGVVSSLCSIKIPLGNSTWSFFILVPGRSPRKIDGLRFFRGGCLLDLRSYWHLLALPLGDGFAAALVEKTPFRENPVRGQEAKGESTHGRARLHHLGGEYLELSLGSEVIRSGNGG